MVCVLDGQDPVFGFDSSTLSNRNELSFVVDLQFPAQDNAVVFTRAERGVAPSKLSVEIEFSRLVCRQVHYDDLIGEAGENLTRVGDAIDLITNLCNARG